MFERHRDKNGEISRKHGNTLIGTLRKHYGKDFAYGCADNEKLGDMLQHVDEPSLSSLIKTSKPESLRTSARSHRRISGRPLKADLHQWLLERCF